MSKRKSESNSITRFRPKHPDLRTATPETLAKALLRPLRIPDPSARKQGRDGE